MDPFFEYVSTNSSAILERLGEHVFLVGIALAIAVPVGLGMGVLLSRERLRPYRGILLYLLGLGQTIPSLAILALTLALIGVGKTSAIAAITLYAIVPIARNTATGIGLVSASVVDAAVGMGMSALQVIGRVEIPLASAYIVAGIRTATVLAISAGALGYLIGAGGLGDLVFTGISLYRPEIMLAGAIPTALLALLADRGLLVLERRLERRRGAST